MATKTTNYNLTKPAYDEDADIAVINANMDIIDAKMKEIEEAGGSGGGGASAWSDITGKPFESIGSGLSVNNGVLSATGGGSGAVVGEVLSDFFELNDGYSLTNFSAVIRLGNIIFAEIQISKTTNFISGQNIVGKVNTKYTLSYSIQKYGVMALDAYNTSNENGYVIIDRHNGQFEVWGNSGNYDNIKISFVGLLKES